MVGVGLSRPNNEAFVARLQEASASETPLLRRPLRGRLSLLMPLDEGEGLALLVGAARATDAVNVVFVG